MPRNLHLANYRFGKRWRGGDAQLILQSMRSDTGGAAAKGQSQPCQPSKVLFTAFVPRQSLEMMGGRRGIACLLVASSDMPVTVARQPCPLHAGIFQGSGMEPSVPCPLMLNP